jgi:hypothetical protein
MLRETQQASPGVLALELSYGDLDECSASVDEPAYDDMSSFISFGGESGLGAARALISQGAVRNYRAFSNMGYDHVNDAASREGTNPREKFAKIRFQAKPPQRKTARSPDELATPQPLVHGVPPSGRVERPPLLAPVRTYGSAQSRSRGGFLQPRNLEGLSITSPPQMLLPEDQEWEHSQSLSRSHRVDDLEELRLSGQASFTCSRVEIERTCRASECDELLFCAVTVIMAPNSSL